MLVDQVKISVVAGDGGDGRVSFRPPRKGPDGGDGGKGGNVYLVGIDDLYGLRLYTARYKFEAEDGQGGMRLYKHGANGEDLYLKVPIGVLVEDINTGEAWEIVDTEPILICKGGNGGYGNNRFKSSTNVAPKQWNPGRPGQSRELLLTLKLIADIGFVGLPNAGKSSLLKALTNADPKIGAYQFTTVSPNLGVMSGNEKSDSQMGDTNMESKIAVKDNRKILADIPGLIEGASMGKGLGHDFLRHIEKVDLIVHCVSAESDDVVSDYQMVARELKRHASQLVDKVSLVALTKVDLQENSVVDEMRKMLSEETGYDVVTVSIYEPVSIMSLKKLLMSF